MVRFDEIPGLGVGEFGWSNPWVDFFLNFAAEFWVDFFGLVPFLPSFWKFIQEISWAKSDGIYANPEWYPGSGDLVVEMVEIVWTFSAT